MVLGEAIFQQENSDFPWWCIASGRYPLDANDTPPVDLINVACATAGSVYRFSTARTATRHKSLFRNYFRVTRGFLGQISG